MAQPWPAWEQTVKPASMAARSMSASSTTMNADLPPSSRNTFFTVSLAAAMMARPAGVEPVKLTMSTRGSVTRTSPTSTSEAVRTLTTPGGMSVWSAMTRARAAVTQGVCGGPFSTTVQPAARAGDQLRQADLQRVVVGDDAGDDADRLLLDPAAVGRAPHLGLAEVVGELVGLEQVGVPLDHPDRGVEGGPLGEHHRHADVGDDRAGAARRTPSAAPGGAGGGSARGRRRRSTRSWCRTPGGPPRWPARRRRRRRRRPRPAPGRCWGRSSGRSGRPRRRPARRR